MTDRTSVARETSPWIPTLGSQTAKRIATHLQRGAGLGHEALESAQREKRRYARVRIVPWPEPPVLYSFSRFESSRDIGRPATGAEAPMHTGGPGKSSWGVNISSAVPFYAQPPVRQHPIGSNQRARSNFGRRADRRSQTSVTAHVIGRAGRHRM